MKILGNYFDRLWGCFGVLRGSLENWGELGRALEAYKQETLIFASETKGRATKTQTRVGRREGARRVQEGARRVQGRGEYGSKGKWKSASAPTHPHYQRRKD